MITLMYFQEMNEKKEKEKMLSIWWLNLFYWKDKDMQLIIINLEFHEKLSFGVGLFLNCEEASLYDPSFLSVNDMVTFNDCFSPYLVWNILPHRDFRK